MLLDYLFPFHLSQPPDPSSARYQGDWCAVGKQGYLAGNTHTVNDTPHNNTPHKDIYRIPTQSIRFPTYHIPIPLHFWEQKWIFVYTVNFFWRTTGNKFQATRLSIFKGAAGLNIHTGKHCGVDLKQDERQVRVSGGTLLTVFIRSLHAITQR